MFKKILQKFQKLGKITKNSNFVTECTMKRVTWKWDRKEVSRMQHRHKEVNKQKREARDTEEKVRTSHRPLISLCQGVGISLTS